MCSFPSSYALILKNIRLVEQTIFLGKKKKMALAGDLADTILS